MVLLAKHRGNQKTVGAGQSILSSLATQIIRVGGVHSHPTQKPVKLLEYLIKTYTNPGMIVLDNTMGSGSTGVAAKKLGRDFIGMELTEKYYKIACERIKDTQVEEQVSLF